MSIPLTILFKSMQILVKDANAASFGKTVTFDYEMVNYDGSKNVDSVRFWETGNTQSKDYSLHNCNGALRSVRMIMYIYTIMVIFL